MTASRRSPALLVVLTLLVMLAQTIAAKADVATPQAEHIPATLATDDPGNTGWQPGPAPAGELEERWVLSPVSIATPVISGDKLFLNSDWDVGATYAHDAVTGDELWRTVTGAQPHTVPLAAEGGVYVAIPTGLLSLDVETGAVLWSLEFSEASAEPELLGLASGVLYAGVQDRWIAIDALSGSTIWERPAKDSETVAMSQGRLFTADENVNAILVLDPATGNEVDRASFDLASLDSPEISVDETGLYVSMQGLVIAFDPVSLEQRWSVSVERVTSAVAIGDDLVFVSDNEGLHALDPETGSEVWELRGLEAGRPLVVGDTVYVTIRFSFTVLNATDGAIASSYLTGGGSLVSVANGLAYVGPRLGAGNTIAIDGESEIFGTPEAAIAPMAAASPVVVASSPSPALVGGGVPMFRANPERTGVNPGPMPEGVPVQHWRVEVGVNPSGISSPVVWENVVLAGSDAQLVALDAATGRDIWMYELEGTIVGSDSVVVSEGVLMRDGAAIRLLEPHTGHVVWENAMLNGSPVSLAAGDGVAAVGYSSGSLYAIDLATGLDLWRADLPIGQPISGAAISEGVVYVTTIDLFGNTFDGSLHALEVATGKELWKKDGLNAFGSPAIADETLYVADLDGILFALNAADGRTIWRSQLPGTTLSSVAVGPDAVYAATGNGRVIAFDRDSGARLWSAQTGRVLYSAPSLAEDAVVVGGRDGILYALDRSDGHELWRFETGEAIYSTPSLVDGRIYFQSEDGFLYALGTGDSSGEQPAAIAASPIPGGTPATTILELSAEFAVSLDLGSNWMVSSSQEGSATLVGGATTVELQLSGDDGVAGTVCVNGGRLEASLYGVASEIQAFNWPGSETTFDGDLDGAWESWEMNSRRDPDPLVVRVECRLLETDPGALLTVSSTTPVLSLNGDATRIEELLASIRIEPAAAGNTTAAAVGTPQAAHSTYAVTLLGPSGAASVNNPVINESGLIAGLFTTPGEATMHGFVAYDGVVSDLDDSDYEGGGPTAINNQGDVVGLVFNAAGLPQAVLWNHDGLTLLPTDGQEPSIAVDINNSGVVAGIVTSDAGRWQVVTWTGDDFLPVGFFTMWTQVNALNDDEALAGQALNAYRPWQAAAWDGNVPIDLETLGGLSSAAEVVNEAGQIAGTANTPDGEEHAVIWNDGAITDLGTLGGETSDVDDINESGQVLGDSDTSDGSRHSYIWQDRTMTDLGLFEGHPVNGQDLNDAGQVVGWAVAADGSYHGVVWQDGVVTDLGTAGGIQSWAYSINNQGQIAGIVELEDGSRQVVRWDPDSPPELLPAPTPTATPSLTPMAGLREGAVLVVMRDIVFEPTELTIPADTNVTVRLSNEGAAAHSFVVEELGINVSLAPGESAEVVINAPPGEYDFVCDVPGHTEAGMVGTLIVTQSITTAPGIMAVINDNDVIVRAGPSVETEVVAVVNAGTELIVIDGEPVEAEGYQWWQVQAVDQQFEGWIIADFLDFSD
jgi:probable HAF family extracellular repeat protein